MHRIVPTALLPLSLLAYTSVIGILSTLLILFVLLFDGFSKTQSPGSLFDPCETHMVKAINFSKTGAAFGLFMGGFAGHSVVPNLALDMRNPTEFSRMIKWAFVSCYPGFRVDLSIKRI
jgi:vesicular inhibitory amino acid transporter